MLYGTGSVVAAATCATAPLSQSTRKTFGKKHVWPNTQPFWLNACTFPRFSLRLGCCARDISIEICVVFQRTGQFEMFSNVANDR